jgi:hypothetical protein
MAGLKRRAPPTILADAAGPEAAPEPRREDPAALAAKLMGGAASLPTTTAPRPAPPPAPARREPSLQINFRVTPKLARLLHDQQAAAGNIGVRCFIARVLKQAGYDVPGEDLEPRFNKRDYSAIGN